MGYSSSPHVGTEKCIWNSRKVAEKRSCGTSNRGWNI